MRPSSLLGVLLDFIETLESEGSQPADIRLRKFFRRRRFLGSHDRRFVADGAYAWLRHQIRGETRWRLWKERAGLRPPEEKRTLHLGSLLSIASDGLFPWDARRLADAAGTFAAARGGGWTEILDRVEHGQFLEQKDWPRSPLEGLAAEYSLPTWLAARLQEQRGDDGARDLAQALLKSAPVDLRTSLSLVEREVVSRDLEQTFKTDVEFTPYSPCGLRLRGRLNLKQFMSRHPGWMEVQDEGSQLAARAASASRNENIIDCCAGSGGKLLAIADSVKGQARFHACDIDASKLAELCRRTEPMGLQSLTVHQISPQGKLPATLPNQADLVVADVPCSGLGSLRRNPDLKRRYDEEDIERFSQAQSQILRRFAPRVRPGGRLLYITCSILAGENEDVAQRFLKEHPNFEPTLPQIAGTLPQKATVGSWLRLDPAVTNTDGFFVALFRRSE